jgi:hypothetical protein
MNARGQMFIHACKEPALICQGHTNAQQGKVSAAFQVQNCIYNSLALYIAGVAFSHPGAYVPVFKLCFKCTFEMLKILNIKFSVYISKFYTFTKWFHRKPTF